MKINIKRREKKILFSKWSRQATENGWYFIIAMENWINCLINYWLEFWNEIKLNEKSTVKILYGVYVRELFHDSSVKFYF